MFFGAVTPPPPVVQQSTLRLPAAPTWQPVPDWVRYGALGIGSSMLLIAFVSVLRGRGA